MSGPDTTPTPVGPYQAVVRAGEWLICSGQLGVDSGEIVRGGVAAELTQAVANLEALLASEGASLADVVKTTVFLVDMERFGEMNDAYVVAFGGNRPARSAIGVVALPRGASVEIEAWARPT